MYLDCDTIPAIPSRSYTPRPLSEAINLAMAQMERKKITEGQIGIYDDYLGNGFAGYVIKYHGADPYFEPAPQE